VCIVECVCVYLLYRYCCVCVCLCVFMCVCVYIERLPEPDDSVLRCFNGFEDDEKFAKKHKKLYKYRGTCVCVGVLCA